MKDLDRWRARKAGIKLVLRMWRGASLPMDMADRVREQAYEAKTDKARERLYALSQWIDNNL